MEERRNSRTTGSTMRAPVQATGRSLRLPERRSVRRSAIALIAALLAVATLLHLHLRSGDDAITASNAPSNVPSRSSSRTGVASAARRPAAVPIIASAIQQGVLDSPGVDKPLKLFSVKPGRRSSEGIAVMGTSEAAARTYVAGAVLQSGARLKEVLADHVILARDAREHSIYVEGSASSATWQAMGERGRSSSGSTGSAISIGTRVPPAKPLQPPASRASDYLRLSPVYDADAITAFSVYAGTQKEHFSSWGLREGDTLISLGGQILSDPAQAESLLDQLASGAELAAEVRRSDGTRALLTLAGSGRAEAGLAAANGMGPPATSAPAYATEWAP